MPREIAKAYEPKQIEPRWAEFWVQEALFTANPKAPGPVFSIVIPPPNVTGMLHIGHMLDHTEIDILTRWHRMRSYNTLYLPGTDHAGISTQRVVVRQLTHEGIHYRDLGREEFIKRVWQWKEESGGTIQRQMKQIGESCDWSRERFTLSPELSRVVREVFVRLYEEKLIYRDKRMVNWCPGCRTVLSDLEVIHEEKQGHLWYIKYPVAGSQEFLIVATTRPETMLGDTAVAVHPEDERYRHLIGKNVLLPLMNREIPVIGDEMVDREFGTGAVKITPAHDPNDFEAGKRHNLPQIDVMTDDAHMNENAGAYAGLERFAARKKIIEDLQAQGLLEKITDHINAIGHCERSRTIVEPRVSTQWFCSMKPLAEPAIAAVERGDVQIIPDNRREEYFNWMRNIRDWTLSRQLWWGHRIPAWYCQGCKEIIVARQEPAKCPKCGSTKLEQDPDVLDTWFSSALWPFSTLGWPEKTRDFDRFYPGSVMETAYDIIFFWVARMMMLGIHLTGKEPFHTVYLSGLIRDPYGQKMSKTKGNSVDPLETIEEVGADALRFALVNGTAPGNDSRLGAEKLENSRNFANKLWNVARFVLGARPPSIPAGAPRELPDRDRVGPADRWILSRAAVTISGVDAALAQYAFGDASQILYEAIWNEYCDWAVELAKIRLADERLGIDEREATWWTLVDVLDTYLRLLHPIMPFITEAIWARLPHVAGDPELLIVADWPTIAPHAANAAAELEVAAILELVRAVRNARSEARIEPAAWLPVDVFVPESLGAAFESLSPAIERLSRARPLTRELSPDPIRRGVEGGLSVIAGDIEAVVRPVAQDGAREARDRARLERELAEAEGMLAAARARLVNEAFVSKAPPSVVAGARARAAELEELVERLGGRLRWR